MEDASAAAECDSLNAVDWGDWVAIDAHGRGVPLCRFVGQFKNFSPGVVEAVNWFMDFYAPDKTTVWALGKFSEDAPLPGSNRDTRGCGAVWTSGIYLDAGHWGTSFLTSFD